jgi:hypothetical protein
MSDIIEYYQDTPEAIIYRSLRKALIEDLILNDVPSSLAGAVVNFYNPGNENYLKRVDAWQRLLCSSALVKSESNLFPPALFEHGWLGKTSTSIVLNMAPWQVQQLHSVVKILYKYHGKARQATDMEAVKTRLRRPGNPSIATHYKDRMVEILSDLKVPTWEDVVGRFGPGVTSDRVKGVDKWRFKQAYPLSVPFNIYDLGLMDILWRQNNYQDIEWYRYGITKIQEVPKSLKSTRVVSAEPSLLMYAQLGVADVLSKELHRVFAGHVSLNSQDKHRELLKEQYTAVETYYRCEGGVLLTKDIRQVYETRSSYASIDLSDASDHVSRRLVYNLLPKWRNLLFAVRSTFSQFPDGELVPLRTFAPMGSGVCFVVLTTICAAACAAVCGMDRRWGVYGDDIIIPVEFYDELCALLESMGLVVNKAKSCNTKMYREACGSEWFNVLDGCEPASEPLDVTPLSIREPLDKVDSTTLEQWLQRCDRNSWVNTARVLLDNARKGAPSGLRWNADLQRLELEVSAWVPRDLTGTTYGREGLVRHWALHTMQEGTWVESQFVPNDSDAYTPSRDCVCRRQWRDSADYSHLTTCFVNRYQDVKLRYKATRTVKSVNKPSPAR